MSDAILPPKETPPSFLIYLDQKDWIYLAQVFFKKPNGEKFVEALDVITALVEQNKVVVPLSGVHMMETATPADRDRRERLARFMIKISRCWCIPPFMTVRNLEIMYAIGKQFKCAVTNRIKQKLIRKGLPYALGMELKIEGVPANMAAEAMEFALSEEVAVKMLVDGVERETVKKLREDDEKAATTLEDIRSKAMTLTDDMRHRVEVAKMMLDILMPVLQAELRSLGLDFRTLADSFNSPDDWLNFFHSIPTMDVFLTLGFHRDKQAGRAVDRNDLKDIGALTMAIPYCDVVVTENFFGHVANATGLAKKYGSVVITDVTQLPDIFRGLGMI